MDRKHQRDRGFCHSNSCRDSWILHPLVRSRAGHSRDARSGRCRNPDNGRFYHGCFPFSEMDNGVDCRRRYCRPCAGVNRCLAGQVLACHCGGGKSDFFHFRTGRRYTDGTIGRVRADPEPDANRNILLLGIAKDHETSLEKIERSKGSPSVNLSQPAQQDPCEENSLKQGFISVFCQFPGIFCRYSPYLISSLVV